MNLLYILLLLIIANISALIISRKLRANAAAEPPVDVESTAASLQSLLDARKERFEFIGNLFKARDKNSLIERNLITAALPIKPAEFMMFNLVFLAVMMVVGLLHQTLMPPYSGFFPLMKRFAWMAFYIYVGWRVPQLILQYLANQRRTKLEYQLADALTIIASGLRGGYSFVQGLDMSSQQLEAPIKDEVSRVLRLVQLGLDTPRALTQMAERVNSYDYDMTVSATNIQLSVGGNLSHLLENIAATIRERIRLRRDIAVLTAQGRISGIILISLPIAIGIMLFILNPEYMSELLMTEMGNNLLYLAGGMQAFGIYWIKKLLDFDN